MQRGPPDNMQSARCICVFEVALEALMGDDGQIHLASVALGCQAGKRRGGGGVAEGHGHEQWRRGDEMIAGSPKRAEGPRGRAWTTSEKHLRQHVCCPVAPVSPAFSIALSHPGRRPATRAAGSELKMVGSRAVGQPVLTDLAVPVT